MAKRLTAGFKLAVLLALLARKALLVFKGLWGRKVFKALMVLTVGKAKTALLAREARKVFKALTARRATKALLAKQLICAASL
jgi:hypothetical protein